MARSPLTPDQLLRIFDEAPSSNVLVSEYISAITSDRDSAVSFFSFDRSKSIRNFYQRYVFTCKSSKCTICTSAGVYTDLVC